jgi:DNA-binding transcriptional ArsR family regulator
MHQLELVNIKRFRNYRESSTLLSTNIDLDEKFDEYDLDEREREVLKFLSSEQNAYFSFQGLRRRLGLHQETLTRTLKRLEEANVIERSAQGYKVKTPSNEFSFTVRTNATFSKPIVDAYLPPQVDVTVLFQRLRGRWFSNFRWLGYSTDGDHMSMSWISEDGQMQLHARLTNRKISISVDSTSSKGESNQITAAYQLFDHVSKVAEEIMQHPAQAPLAN